MEATAEVRAAVMGGVEVDLAATAVVKACNRQPPEEKLRTAARRSQPQRGQELR